MMGTLIPKSLQDLTKSKYFLYISVKCQNREFSGANHITVLCIGSVPGKSRTSLEIDYIFPSSVLVQTRPVAGFLCPYSWAQINSSVHQAFPSTASLGCGRFWAVLGIFWEVLGSFGISRLRTAQVENSKKSKTPFPSSVRKNI